MSVSSGSYYLKKTMNVFDMKNLSVTSEQFYRAIVSQRDEAGRFNIVTKADVEALLGLACLDSGAPYDLHTPLKDKLL
jgi:hypothetical protein